MQAFESVYGLPAERKEIREGSGQIAKYREWFSSPEWIFGSRVPYTAKAERKYPWGGIRVELLVRDGKIQDANVDTDAMDYAVAPALRQALIGSPLTGEALRKSILDAPGLQAVSEDLIELLDMSPENQA